MDRLKPCPAEFADAVVFSVYSMPSVGHDAVQVVASSPDVPGVSVKRDMDRSGLSGEVNGGLIMMLWTQHPTAWEADQSYADAPTTISEARANRDRKGVHLTPRDPAIMFLRDLDAGKLPNAEHVIVAWRNQLPEPLENGVMFTVEYIAQTGDIHTAVGLLEDIQQNMIQNTVPGAI